MELSKNKSVLVLLLILLVLTPYPYEIYRYNKLNTICNDKNIFFSHLNPEEKCGNIIKKVEKDISPYKFFWVYFFDRQTNEKIKELLKNYENENQEDIFDRDEKGF